MLRQEELRRLNESFEKSFKLITNDPMGNTKVTWTGYYVILEEIIKAIQTEGIGIADKEILIGYFIEICKNCNCSPEIWKG